MKRAALAMAGLALAIVGVAACAPTTPPDSPYDICNSAGCGDNVVIVIDNATE